MAIVLATKFAPHTDEKFAAESKKALVTNNDLDWTGANTVKVYKISTADMTDYGRRGPAEGNWSRYGAVQDLDATTEQFMLRKDRSFTFVIDKLDTDETVQQLQAATALERQLREVVIPEVDAYTYGEMCAHAGVLPAPLALTPENIYAAILAGSEALDNAHVPESGRVLVVTPATYTLMKKSDEIMMNTDLSDEKRAKGVIGTLDGLDVQKFSAAALPSAFGFMICHPCATVAPTKLTDYTIHANAPGISGALVEGRICYDAFVLDNKAPAIYYQAQPAGDEDGEE